MNEGDSVEPLLEWKGDITQQEVSRRDEIKKKLADSQAKVEIDANPSLDPKWVTDEVNKRMLELRVTALNFAIDISKFAQISVMPPLADDVVTMATTFFNFLVPQDVKPV